MKASDFVCSPLSVISGVLPVLFPMHVVAILWESTAIIASTVQHDTSRVIEIKMPPHPPSLTELVSFNRDIVPVFSKQNIVVGQISFVLV